MITSISGIKLFKACRRAYELKYIYGLEPVAVADSLETGISYHSMIEQLYKEGDFLNVEEEYSKEQAMAVAYKKYIYPHFKVKSVENWVEYRLPYGDKLIGRVDGIAEDGSIVEHKTTSMEITEEYEYSLLWDEQLLAYMLATGTHDAWYTICRKPTIRQKKDETEEEIFHRMVKWYDDDTQSKIRLLRLHRTDKEIRAFESDLRGIILEMKQTSFFYKNCAYCNKWGRRCEYSSICLNYDPNQEYIEFKRRESVR